MRVWAIADLHLGFSTGKWMDVFGEHWKDHHLKVEDSWRSRVDENDIVLLPGDFSWAMRLNEVVKDFEWLATLPGRKVLIKGNHDYWWPRSHGKLRTILPEGVYAIKKRAVVVDDVPIIGVRGADFCSRDTEPLESTETRLVRERHELLLSIEHLREIYDGDRPPLAMFHYPPFPMGRSESLFTRIVEEAGCSHCIFGHLHTPNEWDRVFQGEQRGVEYVLASCDSLAFKPRLIDTIE